MAKVFVDVIKYNPQSGLKDAVITKTFINGEDFSLFYKEVKEDPNCVVNVKFYDPRKNPKMADYFESTLLSSNYGRN